MINALLDIFIGIMIGIPIGMFLGNGTRHWINHP